MWQQEQAHRASAPRRRQRLPSSTPPSPELDRSASACSEGLTPSGCSPSVDAATSLATSFPGYHQLSASPSSPELGRTPSAGCSPSVGAGASLATSFPGYYPANLNGDDGEYVNDDSFEARMELREATREQRATRRRRNTFPTSAATLNA